MSLNLDKSVWEHVTFGDVVRNVNVTLPNRLRLVSTGSSRWSTSNQANSKSSGGVP